tara:strand:- start:1173 stop:1445 length:273 start_codon:yes stop_codon:yes gene_type:complete
MKLTTKKVKEYMAKRTNEELRHCPNCIAAACNDAAVEFSHYKAQDFLKLVFFNDPIPLLYTHSYGFHTATGRHIIETVQEYYYKYEKLEL